MCAGRADVEVGGDEQDAEEGEVVHGEKEWDGVAATN
jgi:hypothetical protein